PTAGPAQRRAGALDLVLEVALDDSRVVIGGDGAFQFLPKRARSEQLDLGHRLRRGAALRGQWIAGTKRRATYELVPENDRSDRIRAHVARGSVANPVARSENHARFGDAPTFAITE